MNNLGVYALFLLLAVLILASFVHAGQVYIFNTAVNPGSPYVAGENLSISVYAGGGSGNYNYTWTIQSGSSFPPRCPGFNGTTTTTNSIIYRPDGTNIGYTAPCELHVQVTDVNSTNNGTIHNATAEAINVGEIYMTVAITPSNSVSLTPGQSIPISANVIGGSPGSTYTYNFTVFNPVTHAIVANQIYANVSSPSNTFSFVSNNDLAGNTLEAIVWVTGSNQTANSPNSGVITITSADTTQTSGGEHVLLADGQPDGINNPTNGVIDIGQYSTFNVAISNGIPPYTGYWYLFSQPFSYTPNSPRNTIVANILFGNLTNMVLTIHAVSPTSEVFTYNGVNYYVAPLGTNTIITDYNNSNGYLGINLAVVDSTGNYIFASTSSGFDINPALATPILSISNSPILGTNQTAVFTATVSGGTAYNHGHSIENNGYTYNFQIYNSITNSLIANQLYTDVASTTNTFTWIVPKSAAGNTIKANVSVTDSATTSVTTNSVTTNVITITFANSATSNTTTTSPSASLTMPIVLTNSQGIATGPNFQQMVTFNPTLYRTHETSDLGNIRFYEGGNKLYSWCESGCNYSSSNAIFWVKLPSGIPANSNLTLNMTFSTTSLEYDGVYAGEAPEYTCVNQSNTLGCKSGPSVSGIYGQYDNGASVFLGYTNFKGSSVPDGWNTNTISYDVVDANPSVTFSNSVYLRTTYASFATLSNNWVLTKNSVDSLVISESRGEGYYAGSEAVFSNGTNEVFFSHGEGDCACLQIGGGTWNGSTVGQNYASSVPLPSVIGVSGGDDSINYSVVNTLTNAILSGNYFVTSASSSGGGGSLEVLQWIRLRTTPPNGVMPIVSFVSMSNSVPTAPKLTIPSNEVIIGTTSGNEVIVATCATGDTCQIWRDYGSPPGASYLVASGTTSVTLDANTLPAGYSTLYANDTTTYNNNTDISNSISYQIRRIKVVHSTTITLTNNQATAVAPDTQLMIGFNPLNYSSWEANTLNNTVLYFSNGTVAYSWMEGPLNNETAKVYTFDTYDNVVYWFKSPSTNSYLRPGSTNTIILGFDSPSNNLLDGNYIGEAPQYTCANPSNTSNCKSGQSVSGIYGQYDNGALVFLNYTNFKGNSAPKGWNTNITLYDNSSAGYVNFSNSVHLGISYGVSATLSSNWVLTNNSIDTLALYEAAEAYRSGYIIVLSNYSNYIHLVYGYVPYPGRLQIQSSGGISKYPLPIPSVISVAGGSDSDNYTVLNTTNTPILVGNYLMTQVSSGEGSPGATEALQWIRLRTPPPNYVMPSVSFVSMSNSPTTLSTTISSTTTIAPVINGTTSVSTTTHATTTVAPVINGTTSIATSTIVIQAPPNSTITINNSTITTASNFTVSQPFATKLSIWIPTKWQTKNVSTVTGKFVQQTYCSYFVLNNQSVNLITPQPKPVLVNGAFYNTSFTYTPTSRQILVVGGLCRSENITYSAVSGTWSNWSNFTVVANISTIVKAGITPVTPNPLTQFWDGIVTWFENLLKSLGL